MVSPVSVQSQTDMGRLKKKPSSLMFINCPGLVTPWLLSGQVSFIS